MYEELLEPFRNASDNAGVFTDFDGTLSRIVEIPSDARPIEGAREVLARLARRFAVVAIVSGRSAHELVDWLGPDVEIWGVHGAETVIDGKVFLSARAERHRPLMSRVLADARRRIDETGMDGVLVEDKTIMVGLHFRAAEDVERARAVLDGIAADLAREHGLERAGGRMAFELRPPERFTKEEVVLSRARAENLSAALFAGDDRVDIPAFQALDILASGGVHTVRVAVSSDEAPPQLLERADIVVDGPAEMVRLFEDLAR